MGLGPLSQAPVLPVQGDGGARGGVVLEGSGNFWTVLEESRGTGGWQVVGLGWQVGAVQSPAGSLTGEDSEG